MTTFRLSEQQLVSMKNILWPQPVLFEEVDRFISLHTALSSPQIFPNGRVEIEVAAEDTELLHALLQEGSIKIKEIPAALDLLRALTPLQEAGGSLYGSENHTDPRGESNGPYVLGASKVQDS